ncbi:MAG TPA: efflux RND transporter periplasmic adaptor subunit [Bryobacteraceae bacterium]|nr:efflux RND transporter periplasmic adaptor subunit [Bryobacteraceae bacterium]
MKKRHFLLVVLLLAGAVVFWAYTKKNEPPKVSFAKVKRERLVSTLITNGKVEPLTYAAVRVDTAGLVINLPVKEGQRVAKGALLAELSAPGLQAQLTAALARVEEAKAELDNIERGGRKTDLAEIESGTERAKLDHEAALRDYNALRRLEEKQAATREQVASARGKLRQAEIEIESLGRKRAALVVSSDRAVAEAKLRDAEASVQLARQRIAGTAIHAPLAGVLYSLPIRQGAYLNLGDLVGNVGVLDRLRVRVYVDEPELGRVAVGLPVNITWDAAPGQHWKGTVEQMPSAIQPLGTRQVGEVLCTIENPGHELVPGTNVNAEIQASVVDNALTIPKEALRRDAAGFGALMLEGDAVRWRAVKAGASSISRVQILEGAAEGDAVALPTDFTLHDGDKVSAVYP